ncbi:MAG: sigma-54-dependent Fis family transcriptional regulator [Spirochaetes bacterium]|nr:sigma-54-dependent Fis family transcriptional regulator [Spirochaetota bacterium]NLJ05913.1 sigma-54-dependent Fis family transcriptional regulator [Exilispira sp.]MBP8991090.1 sigma-54-dependent Fis family transcriptional regulator [Spirochaetota bacterium]HNV43476.1 sigma-54 dependent transcriptional regulator [Exilispira sp.]HOV45939.1 sigma-54 dependent transcriptional regulator [Exilispira sp.]
MEKQYIVVCDDEYDIRKLMKEIIEDEGYSVITAANEDELLTAIKMHSVFLVFLDIILENENGMDILARLKKDYPDIEVIIITGHGTIDLAVKATKLGAFDFITKPLKIDYISQSIKKIMYVNSLKNENKMLKQKTFIQDEFIGESDEIKKIKDLVKVVGQSDSKVVIYGENGTGKELVARLIHINSHRANNRFVELNCAAIPATLIESELFGYEKGAFTNAFSQKKGLFELASTGTIFLDEIGDMPLEMQAKLLRVIQDGKFTRIGGVETITVDVRIIAATNKNLEEEITKGNFREDLYYRLNVIPIYIPPLRKRKEDIPLLIEYFLSKLKNNNELRIKSFDPDALEVLKSFPWPGNIRQLKNIIDRINILNPSDVVTREFVSSILEGKTQIDIDSYNEADLKSLRESYEKEIIMSRLKKFNFNITKTAQSLDIERTNLYKKLKRYGIQLNGLEE